MINLFLLGPPYEKYQKVEKCQAFNFDECAKYFLMLSVLLKEYNWFSTNNEISLEQQKWNFAFMKKVNNSIATKLRVTLLKNRKLFLK